MLKYGRALLMKMSDDHRIQDTATPLLFHPDLHMRNIFIKDEDPTCVTGFIDWQSTSIEPAFWYRDNLPDFAKVDEQKDVGAEVYNLCTQFLTPKLAEPRLMNKSLFRPFFYCYRTWRIGAPVLRHELIEMSSNWTVLSFDGTCPYPMPTPDEFTEQQKKYKLFEAATELRSIVSSKLHSATDGWVPSEDWEDTKRFHGILYDTIAEGISKAEIAEDEEVISTVECLRDCWPFNLPR